MYQHHFWSVISTVIHENVARHPRRRQIFQDLFYSGQWHGNYLLQEWLHTTDSTACVLQLLHVLTLAGVEGAMHCQLAGEL